MGMPNRTTVPRETADRDLYDTEDVFQVGEVVGRIYEIRAVLGAGGMGQVFEAQDHSLDRRVAIKANWPNLPAPPLRNEARALAAFRHPSLVTVHGLGVHRGTDYLVMERIYGVSLADMLDQRLSQGQRLPVEEAMRILAATAEGLGVVHRAGIAHRDIKPSNVMLTPDHRVVLMDFGLVLPEFDVAQQEKIAGSPPYMAPEALANLVDPGAGQLVDVFALGVTAYEMLVGHVPHPDYDDLQDLWEKLKTPTPSVQELRSDVPEGLSELIGEMMHRDPAARPQSAEAVSWQVKRIAARGARATAVERTRPREVLVVDDDEDIARVLGFYVKKALGNVEVSHVKDGERALERLRRGPAPDVMLLDLHMPKMNGIEVAMYMRGEELAPDCAIVAVSAGAQEHDRQLLHQLGIRTFVEKGSGLGERLAQVLRGLARPISESSPAGDRSGGSR